MQHDKNALPNGEFVAGDMIQSAPGNLVHIYLIEGGAYEIVSDDALRRAVAAMERGTRRVIAGEVGREDDGAVDER